MNYAKLVEEDRRLRILQVLAESADYRAASDLLQTVLKRMGHAVGHDRLETDLAWLYEQGYLTLERIGDTPMARLNGRGLDVAAGVSHVPGIARPRPE